MHTISPETSSCEGWGWELGKNGVGKEAMGGLTPVDLGCRPFQVSAGRAWIRVSRWWLVSQIPCRPLCAAHGVKMGFSMFQRLSKQTISQKEYVTQIVCGPQCLKHLLFDLLQKQICRPCYGLLSINVQYTIFKCLFIYFIFGSSLLHGLFSSCREQKLL